MRACGSGGSAARAQQGRLDVVSVCGRHIRGEIVGTGQLLTLAGSGRDGLCGPQEATGGQRLSGQATRWPSPRCHWSLERPPPPYGAPQAAWRASGPPVARWAAVSSVSATALCSRSEGPLARRNVLLPFEHAPRRRRRSGPASTTLANSHNVPSPT